MAQNSLRPLISRIALVAYIILVGYLLFANLHNVPDIPRKIFGIDADKVVHFCLFFPFPILGYLSCDNKNENVVSFIGKMLCILAIGGVFAGLTEIIQGLVPYRTEDVHDYAADMLSMAIASIIVAILRLTRIRK